MKKKQETFKQPEKAAFLLCRVVPAGLVKSFELVLAGKRKKLLDLGEEIRYNNRIKK